MVIPRAKRSGSDKSYHLLYLYTQFSANAGLQIDDLKQLILSFKKATMQMLIQEFLHSVLTAQGQMETPCLDKVTVCNACKCFSGSSKEHRVLHVVCSLGKMTVQSRSSIGMTQRVRSVAVSATVLHTGRPVGQWECKLFKYKKSNCWKSHDYLQ